jgi:hypothetical protein
MSRGILDEAVETLAGVPLLSGCPGTTSARWLSWTTVPATPP